MKVRKRKRNRLLRNIPNEDRKHFEQFGDLHPIYDEASTSAPSVNKRHKSTVASGGRETSAVSTTSTDKNSADIEVYVDPYQALLTSFEEEPCDVESDDEFLRVHKNEHELTKGAQEVDSDDLSISAESDDSESSEKGEHTEATDACGANYYQEHFGRSRELREPRLEGREYVYDHYDVVCNGDNSNYYLKVFGNVELTDSMKADLQRQVPCWRLDGSKRVTASSKRLYSLLCRYADICWQTDAVSWRDRVAAYGTHCLEHVLKTRRTISNNNRHLRRVPSAVVADQGFTRPTVLVLVPFREDARLLISWFVRATRAQGQDSVGERERFEREFGRITLRSADRGHASNSRSRDWCDTFCGITDDCFRLGVSLNRHSVKLFVPFYKADLIVASPLGLRMLTEGSKVEEEPARLDFLSSIEVLVLDRADVLFMQNWMHVIFIMGLLNQQPVKRRNTDFSRIKDIHLNGKGMFYRQTILLAPFNCTFFDGLFLRTCCNLDGRVEVYKCWCEDGQLSLLPRTEPPVRYLFERFGPFSGGRQPQVRLDYFLLNVLPRLTHVPSGQEPSCCANTLIFVPSYFDYVRLRNRMGSMPNGLGLITLCEHTPDELVNRHRRLFFTGRVPIMLMTERFYFYRRYRIRGVRHLVFYELPIVPDYFHKLCNDMLADDPKKPFGLKQCTVLYNPGVDQRSLCATIGPDKTSFILNASLSIQALKAE